MPRESFDGLKKTSVVIPTPLHKRVQIRRTQTGESLRDMVTRLLEVECKGVVISEPTPPAPGWVDLATSAAQQRREKLVKLAALIDELL